MKLLVLAQIPPPLHGQSLMVQTLVEGLPAHGIAVHHVNLALSRDAADIGRWRPSKPFSVLAACLRAITVRFRYGCDTLYYIPAPGKRGALYRDWVVMLLCRPFFKRVVFHWHAAGLAEWLATRGRSLERQMTQLLLGRADLSIVLSDNLQADAKSLAPKKIAVVPNGIIDPCPGFSGRSVSADSFQVFFLGLCCEEKGLFAVADAVLAANRAVGVVETKPRFTLTAAGSFPDPATARRFIELCAGQPATLRYAGPAHGVAKSRLFLESRCLCLPTHYAAEGQPLVLLEAMAYDLPVIATPWRGIPDTLPPEATLIAPGDTEALSQALVRLRENAPAAGIFRQHYLRHYTASHHLSALAAALTSD